MLTAEEKYEIWLGLVTGEFSQNEAAERYGVDRSTIVRIRKVAKEAMLEALANSKPGRPADRVDPELTPSLRAGVCWWVRVRTQRPPDLGGCGLSESRIPDQGVHLAGAA